MTKLLNKVPQVTLIFWIIKMMSTTVGETGADFLNMHLGIGLTNTSLIVIGLLIIALIFQVRSKRYIPMLYRCVVFLVSIVGTLVTDNMVDNFGISLQMSSVIFSSALALTFGLRYHQEHTLSVQDITTRKRELFYRAIILFTFALGTAVGDLLAEALHLGYALSTVFFMTCIAVITGLYFYFKLDSVLIFWMVYILTRPLGASFGDYLSQPSMLGGLGLGSIRTSILFITIIIISVGILTQKEKYSLSD